MDTACTGLQRECCAPIMSREATGRARYQLGSQSLHHWGCANSQSAWCWNLLGCQCQCKHFCCNFLCPFSLCKTPLGRQPMICMGEACGYVFPLPVQENVVPWDAALKPLRALPPH